MTKANIFICTFVWILYCCSTGTDQLTPEQEDRIIAIGQKATNELMDALKNALVTTIRDSGVVSAISVCNKLAPELARSIADKSESVISAGRTSRKTRNTLNRPDNKDLEVIRYFEDRIKTAGRSVQEYQIRQADGNFRYYRPIYIQPLCLNCHGPRSLVSQDVQDELRTYYPADQAYGYEQSELRGLFKIEIAGDVVSQK